LTALFKKSFHLSPFSALTLWFSAVSALFPAPFSLFSYHFVYRRLSGGGGAKNRPENRPRKTEKRNRKNRKKTPKTKPEKNPKKEQPKSRTGTSPKQPKNKPKTAKNANLKH
jgi:hypothetical protein